MQVETHSLSTRTESRIVSMTTLQERLESEELGLLNQTLGSTCQAKRQQVSTSSIQKSKAATFKTHSLVEVLLRPSSSLVQEVESKDQIQ